jgi:hypothetical protein
MAHLDPTAEPCGIDNRFQVCNPLVQCLRREITVRQPAAPGVIAIKMAVPAAFGQPGLPDRAFKVEVEVGEERSRPHGRWPVPGGGLCDLKAVRRAPAAERLPGFGADADIPGRRSPPDSRTTRPATPRGRNTFVPLGRTAPGAIPAPARRPRSGLTAARTRPQCPGRRQCTWSPARSACSCDAIHTPPWWPGRRRCSRWGGPARWRRRWG